MPTFTEILSNYLIPIADKVKSVAGDSLTDDNIRKGLRIAYNTVLPSAVTFFVKEDKFVEFCMENRAPIIEKVESMKASSEGKRQ